MGNRKEGVEEVEDSEVSARDGTWKEPQEVWLLRKRAEAREAALQLMIRRPEARRKLKLVLHSYRGWRLLAQWDNMRGCSNKFDLGPESSQSLMAARKGLEIAGLKQARDWSLVARCNAFC